MEKLLMRIADSESKMRAFKIISRIASFASAAIFCIHIALLLFREDIFSAIKVASAAGVGYVIVTVLRRLINAPRPYELRTYYKKNPKNKSGCSFPSRHAYSAFVIATLAWTLHPLISISAAVLGISIIVCRVLTGIHFLRDVICGALLGILAGILGILIL